MILYLIGKCNEVLAEVYVYGSRYVDQRGRKELWVARRGRVS